MGQSGNSFHLRFHLALETTIPPPHPSHTWVNVVERQQPVLPPVARVRRQLQALGVRLYRLAYCPNVPLQYAQVVVRLRVGGACLDGGCQQRQRLLRMPLRCVDNAKVVQTLWKGGRREGERDVVKWKASAFPAHALVTCRRRPGCSGSRGGGGAREGRGAGWSEKERTSSACLATSAFLRLLRHPHRPHTSHTCGKLGRIDSAAM